jgi:hypothetical protein
MPFELQVAMIPCELGRRALRWPRAITMFRDPGRSTPMCPQGPLERRFGLGTLVTYTAGTSHSKVNVSGLDFEVARRIRAHLLPDDQSEVV